jgi:hypothetical protein
VSQKNKARDKILEVIKETPLKPAKPVLKLENKEASRKETEPRSSQSKRSVSTNAASAYRKVARPVMPFASDPTKFLENIRKDKYHRKKTDLTQFANATFTGGVFVNGYPGQSI